MKSLLHPLTVLLAGIPVFLLLSWLLSSDFLRLPSMLRRALGAVLLAGTAVAALWYIPSPWTLFNLLLAAVVGTLGLRGDGLQPLTQALGNWRFAAYLLAVLTVAALVYVFVPITTFLTSPGELDVTLDYLFTNHARDTMIIVYCAALAYAFAFTPRMRTGLTLIAVGTLILALLYAYVLPFGYPMMSGLVFEQLPVPKFERAGRVALDVLLVAALGMALWPLVRRAGGKRLVVGILLVDLSLGAAAGVAMHRDVLGAAGGAEADGRMSAQPLNLSRSQPNTLIIFLDRFMGSYVESALQAEPALAQTFSGFTWYPRSLAAGQNSIAGVHPMLGGYDYLPVEMNRRGKPLRDLSVEAFSILPYNFARRGYEVNFVSPRGLGFTMSGDCRYLKVPQVNCTHIPKTIARQRATAEGFPLADLDKSNYTDLLLVLGAMRAAPYGYKELLLHKGPWRKLLDHSAGTTFREWAELAALADMTRTTATRPTFNFVSNILPHEPYYMGEDCRPRRTRLEFPDEEVARRGHASLFSLQHEITAVCSLRLVGQYLDFLKRSQVYDNTRIVVVSDHGIVGKIRDHSTRAVAGGTDGRDFVRTRSVLLVKPRKAQGDLAISESFMPNAEVPRIVCEDIGGCVNPYLGDRAIAAHGRDDPFHASLVPWQFNRQKPEAFVIKRQFVLTGKDPYDIRNWREIEPPAAQ